MVDPLKAVRYSAMLCLVVSALKCYGLSKMKFKRVKVCFAVAYGGSSEVNCIGFLIEYVTSKDYA